tara:strand:- start:88 stop:444 length:357 start_codon:yes stop_codon:yes gene_type:complete
MSFEISEKLLPFGAILISGLAFFLGFIGISMAEKENRINLLLGKILELDIKVGNLPIDTIHLIHGKKLEKRRWVPTLRDQLIEEVNRLQRSKRQRPRLMIGVLFLALLVMIYINATYG